MLAEASALPVRLSDLRTQVEVAKQTVRRLSEIDKQLFRRVSGRLDELAVNSEETLDEVLALLDVNAGQSAWEKLRTAQKFAASLSRESLAFTEGAMLRRDGLDGGLCELADKLLDYLNDRGRLNWRGFTILGETAFYGEVGEVIRLRFPELSIWHLPVAAHEFGHFANPGIRVEVRDGSYWGWKHPVEAYLEEEWKRSLKSWFHTHEYLADIFAVYTVGPAYAYCSIILRADPGKLRSEYPTHPSWNERYFVMIETLREITSHGGATHAIVDDIEGWWHKARAEGIGGQEPDILKLRAVFEEFYPLLRDELRGTRYTTFGRAQQLVGALENGKQLLTMPDDVTIPDVLNAAWLARLEAVDDEELSDAIGTLAADMCRHL